MEASNSADPCRFSAKSVDPPKFLFKSKTPIIYENRSVKGSKVNFYM